MVDMTVMVGITLATVMVVIVAIANVIVVPVALLATAMAVMAFGINPGMGMVAMVGINLGVDMTTMVGIALSMGIPRILKNESVAFQKHPFCTHTSNHCLIRKTQPIH